MKSNIKFPGIAGCLLIGLISFSCRSKNKPSPPEGFEKVEAPKESFSQLKNPDPIQVKDVSSDEIQLRTHSFVFLVDGKAFSQDIIEAGEVISASEKELVVKSPEKGNITMRYTLPGGLRIPAKPGEILNIDFRYRYYHNSIGYTLSDHIGERLVHASGKIFNGDTIQIGLTKGVFIYQGLAKKTEEKKSDFGTIRDIPVFINVNGRITPVTPGRPQEVDIYGSMFTVFILVSTEMRSSAEKISSSEGDGFTLEYAIVKRQ